MKKRDLTTETVIKEGSTWASLGVLALLLGNHFPVYQQYLEIAAIVSIGGGIFYSDNRPTLLPPRRK